jgi:hypothetical protein
MELVTRPILPRWVFLFGKDVVSATGGHRSAHSLRADALHPLHT